MEQHFRIKVHISQVRWEYITSILPYLYKHTMSRQWEDIATEYEALRN